MVESAAKPVYKNTGRFNDYPEREYISSEMDVPGPYISNRVMI